LLIEKSIHDGSYWVTAHSSPADATEYVSVTDASFCWEQLELLDLETQKSYTPSRFVEFFATELDAESTVGGRIARLLHGREWGADDLGRVADIVCSAGYTIGEPVDVPPLDTDTDAPVWLCATDDCDNLTGDPGGLCSECLVDHEHEPKTDAALWINGTGLRDTRCTCGVRIASVSSLSVDEPVVWHQVPTTGRVTTPGQLRAYVRNVENCNNCAAVIASAVITEAGTFCGSSCAEAYELR
jgi:hypothetical protein